MAKTSNFERDLNFRREQLAQQVAEANALATYRLYRTQLIERGMLALEADKAAREMALNVANAAYQQQMGRAQAVLNAPRGPADWAAYANRLRGLQQSGELPGVLGQLALPGRTALYSNAGQNSPIPLTNTQFADAATFGLTAGTPQAPELAGPAWATQRLQANPYQAPDAFPAYYGNPVRAYRSPSGDPPYRAPYPQEAGTLPLNPPGYGSGSYAPPTSQQMNAAYSGYPTGGDPYGAYASPYAEQSMQSADTLFGQQWDQPYYGEQVFNPAPTTRGLYGSDVSYQQFRNLSPTEQELAIGYAQEGMGGFEPQSKEDFLSGMLNAAPNYAPAATATWAGI